MKKLKKVKDNTKDNGLKKQISIFDHIKNIRCVKDVDYFSKLSDLDKKTFNPFMIMKGLSMNAEILDEMSGVIKYLDIIPHPQLYKLLIDIVPQDNPRKYYPWVKSKKESYNEKLLNLMSSYYGISHSECEDYISIILNNRKNGKEELKQFCQSFGLEDKEIDLMLK